MKRQALSVLLLSPALVFPAAAGEICVACSGPPEIYRCVVEDADGWEDVDEPWVAVHPAGPELGLAVVEPEVAEAGWVGRALVFGDAKLVNYRRG